MRYEWTLRRLTLTMILGVLAYAGTTGLAAAQTSPSASASAQVSSATLASGDVVKISVYGSPDLTTTTRVSPSGTITFPLIGMITVGGSTPFEAEQAIANKLRRGGYVENAAVTIFVEERSAALTSSATLLGQVVRSGIFTLDKESADSVSTLVGLLAKAGGTTDKASDHCFLIRKEKGQLGKVRIDLDDLMRNGNIKANITLVDGDVVLVPEMDVFYIYGEVQKPGRYRLERDMSVMQGLAVASGMTPRGSPKGIFLNRQGSSGSQSVKSELNDSLQPNDVVYVKTAVF